MRELPRRLHRAASVVALAAVALAGCTPTPSLPNLREIYSRVALEADRGTRLPLIRVPGTLGSRLVDSETGTDVWGGGSAGISADPDVPFEARLIALPIVDEDVPIREISDSVRPAGVLDTAVAEVLGVPIDIEVYGGIERTLAIGGFRTRIADRAAAFVGGPRDDAGDVEPPPAEAEETPENSFRFDYDWRHDIVKTALDFDRFIRDRDQRVRDVRAAEGRPMPEGERLRFDLLAHSMGSLVTRYYLMHGAVDLPEDGSLPPITWAGADHFDTVVFIAPPNGGSVIAFDNLINGKELGPFQPVFPPALLATHPSVWQLMPRARHGAVRWDQPDMPGLDDLYDPDLWHSYRWALADPEAGELLEILMPGIDDPLARRQRALTHQARLLRRAEQFHRAIDRWTPPPAHLRLFLVVGGGFRTPATALVSPDDGAVMIDGVAEGDGVVLRTSALLDERVDGGRIAAGTGLDTPLRFDTILFLPDEHVELTKNPVFGDNLLFWLLEQPRSAPELIDPSRGGTLLADGDETDAGIAAAAAPEPDFTAGSDR